MKTQQVWERVMDSTPSDWMRFCLMTSYARELERELEKRVAEVALLASKRDALITLLQR